MINLLSSIFRKTKLVVKYAEKGKSVTAGYFMFFQDDQTHFTPELVMHFA